MLIASYLSVQALGLFFVVSSCSRVWFTWPTGSRYGTRLKPKSRWTIGGLCVSSSFCNSGNY
jgi:hypothetical protein